MKTTSYYLFGLLAACLFLLGGCAEEELSGQRQARTLKSLHATMAESVETKAYLTEGNNVVWDNGDDIGVYSDLSQTMEHYTCYFPKDDGGVFEPTGNAVTGNKFYAVYPYNQDTKIIDETKVSFLLNSNQECNRKGSFDRANCPMVATSTDTEFGFRQTCGLIRIKLKGTMTVNWIELTSNDGTPIAGEGFIELNAETPLFRLDETSETLSNQITINAIERLSEDEETSFYFVLPEMTLEKGFTIHIIDGAQADLTVTMRTNKPVQIKRSTITTFTTVDTEHELQQEEADNRNTLIALYNAMGGKNWFRQENWCTDAPLSEWEGIWADAGERVIGLDLAGNNLTGSIPKEIGDLGQLGSLDLSDNNLTGSIPVEISQLTNLYQLNVGGNEFSGQIPPELTATEWWGKFGWNFVDAHFLFDFDSYNIYIPDFTYQDQNGNSINSTDFVRNAELTIYYGWNANDFYGINGSPAQLIAQAYQRYKNKGLKVLGLCADWDEYQDLAVEYMDKYEMDWPTIVNADPWTVWNLGGPRSVNVVYLFDKTGKLLYYNKILGDENLMPTLEELLGEGEVYESTDFSADGKVHELQTATAPGAKGINLVLMGDGFSDRQIRSGLYADLMHQTMEAFFTQEPFYSFRELFNVYYVDVVSKHETVMEGNETALGCYLGSGTTIGGTDEICREYASKCGIPMESASSMSEAMNETLIIVLANTVERHGTCYMYSTDQFMGDYGRGHAVAYFTLDDPEQINTGTAIHEAAGHGFAKLADEYISYAMLIPDDIKQENLERRDKFGWYKNVDYTNDPSAIYWSKFIADERYRSENIGAFLGGDRYMLGIWHPTENSIMNDNTGEFNAPSREAIYYRIHKLAYGESWNYDYEEFVNWDLARRRVTTRTLSTPTKTTEPTVAPVVIKGHWRNGAFIRD